MYTVASIIVSVANFYVMVIFVYVIMTWFPLTGIVEDIHKVLGSVCEPYLGLFRKIIPPVGGTLDFSPIIAIVVLQLVVRLIVRLLV